jgi:undecaprenyl-diphosphatase
MTALEALFLGILQGATEFLPVSSSGHLVMGQALLGLSLPGIGFEIIVHLATLGSVLLIYRKRILDLLRGVLVDRDPESLRYVGLVALATSPLIVVGLFLADYVEALFQRPEVVGFALLITGALLFSTRWALRRPLRDRFGWQEALIIGLAQCLALTPGISRSGSTVVTALWLGISPVEAAAFSFLLSIPAIAGAAVLMYRDVMGSGGAEVLALGAVPLSIAFVAAAVTGVLAIRTFVAMLRNRSFPVFAYYVWGVGTLFLFWLFARG